MKEGGARAAAAARALRDGYSALARNSVAYVPQGPGRNIDPDGLGGYVCDLRHKAHETAASLAAEGADSPLHWPIPIAQAALGFWELRLEGEAVDGEFLRLADWFIEHQEVTATGTVWRADLAVPKYGLEPGWISAMGQGQAISVLLRAHKLTGEARYLELAEGALRPLLLPVAEGGAQRQIDGATVLEEYQTEKPCGVLNGWIFALWGVHELSLVSASPEAGALFERSAAGLVELLPRYDVGWWSLYSLYDHGRPDLAKPFYQELHPVMLEGLELITGAPELGAYARRWRGQRTRFAYARVFVDKLAFRLLRAIRSA
jgi:heparosan-N-sulfate-glucuronate 5-epimerase